MSTVEPVTVPLREDPAEVLRVGDSRVLLEVVVHAFQCGATPETIVQFYETLSLADVYAVLAYCLTHREQIDEYLSRCDAEAADVRRRAQALQADRAPLRPGPGSRGKANAGRLRGSHPNAGRPGD